MYFVCVRIENLCPIPCPEDVRQVQGFLFNMLPLKMTGTLLWTILTQLLLVGA